ncbi:MAG: hypothetical protein Q9181_007027 [Wetmoreana brouardii]
MFRTRDVSINDVVNPVTALAVVELSPYAVLLAGEGPYVKIFDHGTGQLLAVERVFETQAIHGIITTKQTFRGDHLEISMRLIYIWGGRWLRKGRLYRRQRARSFLGAWAGVPIDGSFHVQIYMDTEIQLNDWILEVRFEPLLKDFAQDPWHQTSNAVLVTAHNDARALLSLQGGCMLGISITHGPRCILYTACIDWTEDGRILVAAGTAFGEVLVWSFADSALVSDNTFPAPSQLHYRFTGHEGSVFGIRISPRLQGSGFEDGKRWIASCSDDRTIRVWDVSNLEAHDDVPETDRKGTGIFIPTFEDEKKSGLSNKCIATVMGHMSRIWDVHFARFKDRLVILSIGEDSTAQTWQLVENISSQKSLQSGQTSSYQLIHWQTHAYHSGKNIWASAVFRKEDGTYSVCTGAADGRTVSYTIHQAHEICGEDISANEWTMADVATQFNETKTLSVLDITGPATITKETLCQRIFGELPGVWIIKRNIKSALATYPSGTFVGEARFEGRPQIDREHDEEYLYTEIGTYTSDQGLDFAATRQYVYRYQRESDTMSVWFVKADNHSTADYLFHELRPESESDSRNGQDLENASVVRASSYHLCNEDHYTPSYEFYLKDLHLCDWKLSYHVKGPQKDYIAEASYGRNTANNDHEPANSEMPIPATRQVKGSEVCDRMEYRIEEDSFKSYVLMSHSSFLTTTAQGRVLSGSLVSSVAEADVAPRNVASMGALKWDLVGHFDALTSSGFGTRAVGSNLVLISGNDGTVFTYNDLAQSIRPTARLSRKVAFLYAQRLQTQLADAANHIVLATCLGLPVAYVYRTGLNSTGSEYEFQSRPFVLAVPEPFVVTSACYIEGINVWLLGSRNGALAVYDASKLSTGTATKASSVLQDVHGQDAVTCIVLLPEQMERHVYTRHMLTSGRDGHYAVHILTTNRDTSRKFKITLRTVHRPMPPFGPNIEGASFDEQTHDLLLWGFRSKEFVVWNASKDIETMTIKCGGAHRNWCYYPRNDGSDGGTFVWTKASVCHVRSQRRASHRVFQAGGHGREIKAMDLSPVLQGTDGSKTQYIATGAEDTAIRIWSHHPQDSLETGFKCLQSLTKHTTGIQQLRWSTDGGLLFSAAGREEFFVWRIQPVPYLGIGVMCEATCPAVTEGGDLRIMDMALKEIDAAQGRTQPRTKREYFISIVYSDSSIRIFHYSSSPRRKTFTLSQSGVYNNIHCLTQIANLHPDIDTFLCTASSDGHLALWPLNTENNDKLEERSEQLRWSYRVPVHQSSIKSLSAIKTEIHNQFLIATGGDDGALGITLFEFGSFSDEPECARLLIPKAHAAAINSVVYVGKGVPRKSNNEEWYRHVFVSSGSDQRVKTWVVKVPKPHDRKVKGVYPFVMRDRYTSVADVAAMATATTEDGTEVFVAGVGMEHFKLEEQGQANLVLEGGSKGKDRGGGVGRESAAAKQAEDERALAPLHDIRSLFY